jgi:hypothetical protein
MRGWKPPSDSLIACIGGGSMPWAVYHFDERASKSTAWEAGLGLNSVNAIDCWR